MADALLGQVLDLRDLALAVLSKAEEMGELRATIAAIGEARASAELLAS